MCAVLKRKTDEQKARYAATRLALREAGQAARQRWRERQLSKGAILPPDSPKMRRKTPLDPEREARIAEYARRAARRERIT